MNPLVDFFRSRSRRLIEDRDSGTGSSQLDTGNTVRDAYTKHRPGRSSRVILIGAAFGLIALVGAQAQQNPTARVAQNGSLNLPLASVGSVVGWKIGSEDYRIVVPAAAAGRETSIEVYSPEINRNDYANKRNRSSYYGDELYGKNATLRTTYTVTNPDGSILYKNYFNPTNQHSWVQLYGGTLQAGVYPITVNSIGNGKNAFGLRSTSGVRIEASQFTVNARGQFNQDQVVGFIDFGQAALGKTIKLSNYDADGPQEMILTIVTPDGKRRQLTSSADTKWATDAFVVTKALVGSWKILARILPTTKQFSNAFAFRVRLGDQPYFVRVPGFATPAGKPIASPPPPVAPATGTLRVNAAIVSCGVVVPLPNAKFTINGVKSTAPVTLDLEPGEYDLTPDGLPGSSAKVSTVTLKANETTDVTLEYTVNNTIKLEPKTLNLEVGQTATLGVTVTNGFPSEIPVKINVALPDGLKANGPTTVTGNVSASHSLSLSIPVKAEKPITNGIARASLEPNCGAADTTTVNAVGNAQLKLIKTVDKGVVEPGDKVNFTLKVTNTGNLIAKGVQLTDNLPDGLTGDVLRETFDLEAGASKTFTVPATVNATTRGELINTATVTLDGQRLNATAKLSVQVAQLKLIKTVDKATANPGETVTFKLTVTNTGNATAKGVQLTDALPVGLSGQALMERFDLEPSASKTFTIPATVDAGASGDLTNTAKIGYGTQESEASATVRVSAVVQADLGVTKTASAVSVRPGEPVTYTLSVTNNGPSNATGVNLTDTLPAGLTFESATSSQGTCAFKDGTITCAIGDLNNKADATATVKATTTANATGKLTNTATVKGNEPDPVASNNTASNTVEIGAPAQGILRVTAFASSCNVRTPINGPAFTVNGQRHQTPTSLILPPGEYTVAPETIAGASAKPVTITVKDGETSAASLEYTVVTDLKLEPAALDLKLGQTAKVTATASTAFPYPVPASISLALPDGLSSPTTLKLDGQISSDKPLSLTVPVRATKTVQNGVLNASLEPGCGITDTTTVNATPNDLPAARRESEVVLLARVADAPTNGYIVLADRIPANANYIAGSSRLLKNPKLEQTLQPTTGEWTPNPDVPVTPIGDPLVSGDRLFWVIPATPATLSKLGLTNQVASRKNASSSLTVAADTNLGVVYRLAHTDALEMPKDRVGVLLVLPGARSANPGATRNPVKLDPASLVGQLVGQGDLRLVQGDASVLERFATARPFGAPIIEQPEAVGGPAVSIRLSPVRLTNAPTDQPALLIEAFDRDGKPASDAFVTLEISPEPATPDAAPEQSGYQAKLENGRAVVQLTNLNQQYNTNPPVNTVTAEARITNANGTVSSSTRFNAKDVSVGDLAPAQLPVSDSPRPWVVVGATGVQFNVPFGGGDSFSVAGSLGAFAKGNIFGDAVLTIAVNWRANYDGAFTLSGSLLPPANPYERFPLLGDSSILGSEARSSEGTFIRLEKGLSYIQYGQIDPGFTGLLNRYAQGFNGLQGMIRTDALNLNAFAAWVPNANESYRKQGDVSPLYLIGKPVVESSERAVITVVDKNNPSLKVSETLLVRGRDYQIDYGAGVIELSKPLTAQDANGNPQFLDVRFASSTPSFGLRAGAQARLNLGNAWSLSATGLYFDPGSNLGLLGAGLGYSADGLQFSVEGSYSGSAPALAAQFSTNSQNAQFNLRYQELWPGYVDPNTSVSSGTGRALQANFTWRPSDSFSINASFAHNQFFDGSNTGNANDAFSLEARNRFGFISAALGLAGKLEYTGSASTNSPLTGLWVTGGLEVPIGPFTFAATQRVPITGGTYGQTVFSIDYAVSPNFGIRLNDTLIYEPGNVRQQLGFGARGTFTNADLLRVALGNELETPDTFGTTNISATYDLDTTDGNASRARLGLDTTIPLGANFSTQLGGEFIAPVTTPSTGGVYLGLLYSGDATKASARATYSIQPSGVKQVYSLGGIFQLSSELVLSPSLEYAKGPEGEGGKFSIAGAYRGDDWSILTNNRGRFGFYAPQASGKPIDQIEGELWFGFEASEHLFLRFGGAYLATATDFTGKIAGGATYFFTDQLGAGLAASYIFNPSNGLSALVFGVEGSYRLFDGFLFTVGLNLNGATGLGAFSVQPGLYFRLDWKFDERTFGLGR